MTPEIEAADYLLKHGETLVKDFRDTLNPNLRLLPDFYIEIFEENYSEILFEVLKHEIEISLKVNPEDLDLFFTKNWVTMLLGKDVLCLPKS